MKIRVGHAKAGLLVLGASLLPVYAFGSGGVQPAHALLALFAVLILLSRTLPVTLWSVSLFGMFLHSFLVESVYVLAGGDPATLINSAFNLYSFLLATAIYVYVRSDGLSALVAGVLVAATISVATVLISGVDLKELGDAGRSTGTFNNPNQLGYFSTCLLSLTYLFYRHGQIKYWVASLLFLASGFLAIASLSKAAIVANLIVMFIALKPVLSPRATLAWSLIALGTGWGIFVLYTNGAFDEFLFVRRLENMASEGDSSLESRGYFAILDGNALQLLFGLGAQQVEEIVGHEVHSTFGSVVNNYGLLGLTVFVIAFSSWASRLWRAYGSAGLVCIAGPAMLYGVTHNGTRFSIFWILFAASLAMAYGISEGKRQKRGVRLDLLDDAPRATRQQNV